MPTIILKRPHITEKVTDLAQLNKYVFVVDQDANASEVKKAVESMYKVKVTKVNMLKKQSRSSRYKRIISKGSKIKKAIITLKKGDKLDIIPS